MHEHTQQTHTQNKTSTPRAETTSTTIIEQVERYQKWLSLQDKRDISDIKRESNEYGERATKIVEIGEKRIQSFAPFRYKYSALQTITAKQGMVVGVLILLLVLGFIWDWRQASVVLISIIALGYLVHLVLDFGLAIAAIRQPSEEYIDSEIVYALRDADWPRYTILCPLYREAQVVPQFVAAMRKLDYPADKLQILFLTEADDAETRNAILALRLPSHFHVVTVPDGSPRTKPRACNYGLIEATGQYVVIYDAEDVPDPLQLKKVVLTFANHSADLACVQAKLNFYNPAQNLLTRWFTAEYSLWFDLILPGLQQSKLAIPLGGTSNHFPTQTLRALGAWDAFNVTEDCDLGLRLAWFRLTTVVLDSTTYEEANSRFKNWIRQRSRWIKGYMQTYLVHMREPLHYLQHKRLLEFISLQLVIGGKAAVLLINPLMWLFLILSIILHQVLGEAYGSVLPRPILYISAVCLVLGNFFYGYIYLLGCMRRQQYALVKWTLLIPLYWIMASISAYIALQQLITKPHYWEKTVHGLHLKNQAELSTLTPDELIDFADNLAFVPLPDSLQNDFLPSPVQRYERLEAVPVVSVQATIEEMVEQRKPAFSAAERQAWRQTKRIEEKDFWPLATIATAAIAGISACRYFSEQHQLRIYSDAQTHLNLARHVLDSTIPFDITRIGGIWLPLPQLLMLPFIWNNYLWRSGLAGSIPSIACYIVTALTIFLLARRLTNNSFASFIGSLVFILNPNVLYLQSSPLSETVFLASFIAAIYYFVCWAQADKLKDLLFAAISTALAGLTRYEGWELFLALAGLVVILGIVKRQPRAYIEGSFLVFLLLGGLGIGLWLFWNTNVFGDPLYFLHSPYAPMMLHIPLTETYRLYTYHNLWQALRFYALDTVEVMGILPALLTAMALVVWMIRQRFRPVAISTLALLTPFAFYVIALYTGQEALLLPSALPPEVPQQLFNVRYGVDMTPAAAIFIATLIGNWNWQKTSFSKGAEKVAYLTYFGLILAQMIVISLQGVVVLQDGLRGVSCAPAHAITVYLAQYYTGGNILQDTYSTKIDQAEAGLKLRYVIDPNSGPKWQAALHDPATNVDWIIMQPGTIGSLNDPPDLVAQHIQTQSPAFLSQFTLIMQESSGIRLYYKQAAGPLHIHLLAHDTQFTGYQCSAMKNH
jgi:cellulose synthase/poly-beta-1,6-N-acetylglucosamine synthase-like glycosyltransferase